MGSVTPTFSQNLRRIKGAVYQGICANGYEPTISGCGTAERYVTRPSLIDRLGNFATQSEIHGYYRLCVRHHSVWHSTNDGENPWCHKRQKEIAIIGHSYRQQGGIHK
jgi:hypothetical protein